MIVRARQLPLNLRKYLDVIGSPIVPKPLSYRAEKWELYCQAKLTAKWYRTYRKYPNGHLLFGEDELRRKQIPQLVNGEKQGGNAFFPDFILGIDYLKKRYGVIRDYRDRDLQECPQRRERHCKARKLLGEEGANFVCNSDRKNPHDTLPPDLLVFDSQNRFFFSEAKLKTINLETKKSRYRDRLEIPQAGRKDTQLQFFVEIEEFLNRLLPPSRRALSGHWVEVVYLEPKLE